MDSKRIRKKSGIDLCGFCGGPGVKTVYRDKLFGKSESAIFWARLVKS